ncbi:TVP38/TMEM64 family protein [Dokdonella sp.]|uniref:TVP38/TMEM64 family protein n=1 Tax=Dokdonella sp. TaxID=2291710 RepID=UPI003C591BD0
MTGECESPPRADRRKRLLRRELRSIVPLAAAMVLFVAAVVLIGHEAHLHLHAFEAWIAQLGPWGMIAFVGVFIVGTSVFVPESLFSFVAGVLFGLAWGIGIMLFANLLAAALQYGLARKILRAPIQRWLQSRPLLRSIQKAVTGNELRLQCLLRLTPLSPAPISYLLGAAGVRFPGFILSSLVLITHVAVEVYLGHASKQLVAHGFNGTQQGWQHGLLVYGGTALGILAVVLVSKVAHKAVLNAIAESDTERNNSKPD